MDKVAEKLSATARKHIAPKNFGITPHSSAEKARPGSYPVPDLAHARNALARVAQHGSPSEQAQVRAKVHAKFPGIGKKASIESPFLAAFLDEIGNTGILSMTGIDKAACKYPHGVTNEQSLEFGHGPGLQSPKPTPGLLRQVALKLHSLLSKSPKPAAQAAASVVKNIA